MPPKSKCFTEGSQTRSKMSHSDFPSSQPLSIWQWNVRTLWRPTARPLFWCDGVEGVFAAFPWKPWACVSAYAHDTQHRQHCFQGQTVRRTTGNKLQILLLLSPLSVDKAQETCRQMAFSHIAFCPSDLENADSRVRLTFVSQFCCCHSVPLALHFTWWRTSD